MTEPSPVNVKKVDSPLDMKQEVPVAAAEGAELPVVGDLAGARPETSLSEDPLDHGPGESEKVLESCGIDAPSAVEDDTTERSELVQLLTPISANLIEINRRLESIESTAEIRLKRDTNQQGIIDRLHAELQVHKDGLVLKLLQPLATDLISVVDDIGRTIDRNQPGAVSAQSVEKLVENFGALREELEIILERYGFVPSSSDQETFDPQTQRSVRRVATPDATLDRKIAQRLGKCYSYGGRQIRPELVAVYRAETPAEQTAVSPAS